jgi:hypothetical protein
MQASAAATAITKIGAICPATLCSAGMVFENPIKLRLAAFTASSKPINAKNMFLFEITVAMPRQNNTAARI